MGKQYWKPGNLLYPVPVVMVSCQREGEKPNIITAAWCGTTSSTPATLYVSIRPERHSHAIIHETGEFVVNLVNRDLVFATDYCGVKSGRDVDKFKEMKLTPLPSQHIKAPGIAESPVNLECKVMDVKSLGTHDMFLAEVVGVTVDDGYMDESGKFNLNHTGLVAYSHGEYFELGEKLGSFGYSVKKPEKKSVKPAGKTSGKPAGKTSGKPAGETSGKSAGETSGKSAGETSGKPAGETSGKPAGKAFGKPAGKAFGKSAGKPSGNAVNRKTRDNKRR